MATTSPPASTGAPSAARPFDQTRSNKLDELIARLEAFPPGPRRRMLRWHKRWLERAVPAWPERGQRS